MDSDMELQSYSNIIEGTLCKLDYFHDMSLKDASALKILEMLLDKYHFHDSDEHYVDIHLGDGFDAVVNSILNDMADVSEEVIVKILSIIHFVARRRTHGGREYFKIIQEYVGLRIGTGVRMLPNSIK